MFICGTGLFFWQNLHGFLTNLTMHFFSKLFCIYLFLAKLFFILLLALNLKKWYCVRNFLLNDLCLLCFIIEAYGFLGSIHSENDFQRKYLIRKPFYNKPFLNDFSLYTQRDSNRIVIWLALQDVTTWKIGENTCQNTTREKWLNFTSLRTGITSQES